MFYLSASNALSNQTEGTFLVWKGEKEMKKHYLFPVFLIIMWFPLGIGTAKAQQFSMHESTPTQTQSLAGGAIVQTVTTFVSNPAVANPAFSVIPAPPPPPPGEPPVAPPKVEGTIEAGFQSLYSPHVQIYNIPLSYAFTDNLKMELSVPYVNKKLNGEYTGKELSANGLGDVSVGAKYRYGDIRKIQGMTSFYLKLPTGENKQFKDGQEQLALGTGSYDFTINQNVTGFFGNVMVIANVGYTFNTKSDYTEINDWGANVKYENRAGNVFYYLAGAEYYTPVRRLVVYMNMAGIIMDRSHISETYSGWPSLNRDEDKKDSLQTLDIIAGVKYMLTENTGLRLGFVAPLLTRYDSDAIDTQGRDWLLDFGFSGRF